MSLKREIKGIKSGDYDIVIVCSPYPQRRTAILSAIQNSGWKGMYFSVRDEGEIQFLDEERMREYGWERIIGKAEKSSLPEGTASSDEG